MLFSAEGKHVYSCCDKLNSMEQSTYCQCSRTSSGCRVVSRNWSVKWTILVLLIGDRPRAAVTHALRVLLIKSTKWMIWFWARIMRQIPTELKSDCSSESHLTEVSSQNHQDWFIFEMPEKTLCTQVDGSQQNCKMWPLSQTSQVVSSLKSTVNLVGSWTTRSSTRSSRLQLQVILQPNSLKYCCFVQ